MNDLVSIIVPIYNVQKYLPRCIESVLNQTYKNFELILVDDSSPDKCGEICDYYAKKDSRIVVIHKQNGGVSSARNAGLDVAKGKYVNFIDGDDWIPNNSIESLIEPFVKYSDVQASVGGICIRDGKMHIATMHEQCIDFDNLGDSNYFDFFITKSHLSKSAHHRMYLRELLNKNDIRFRSDMKIEEDSFFVYKYLACCTKNYVVEKVVYNYNKIVPTSATKKKYGYKYITDMRYVRLQEFFPIVEKMNLDEIDKQHLIACNAMKDFISSVYGVEENEIEEGINYAYNKFEKWMFLTDNCKILDNKPELKKAIIERDNKKIYEILCPKNTIKNILNRFKNTVKTILIPYLEKHRDGLIDYKKILKDKKQGEN